MKNTRPASFRLLGLATATLMLGLAACDETIPPDDDHAEPEGARLTLNGQVVASYDGDSNQWTGELHVDAGEETAHIRVEFLDHDGDALDHDDDEYLEVVIADASIAEFEQDTPGEFGGHLHGVAAGETTCVFRLMHGAVGSGHADFETSPMHVHVEEPTIS